LLVRGHARIKENVSRRSYIVAVAGRELAWFKFVSRPCPFRFPNYLRIPFQIAWEYLERTGELGDAAAASRFLSDTIETMIRRGQRSPLALSNRAIITYQRHRSSGAAGSAVAACSSA
jgi:hypothetical protein